MGGPLSGYRVTDLSRAIAGPYGSMLLGDLGAEIIKIEAPVGVTHARPPGPNHKGESFHYLAFNRNKKSLTLDLGTPSGKEVFYDLVRISDVVWDNFRPGVLERLGADYETIKKVNPRIISCSISGYGSTGPYVDRPALDVVAQGIAGTLSTTGEPGGRPTRPGFPAADVLGGLFAALSAVSALADRERTGEGQRIDVALLDSMISVMAYDICYHFLSGIVPGQTGSGHRGLLPYGVYKCKEGYVVIAGSWPKVARLIGADSMIDDPRFKEIEDRLKNREEFVQLLEEYLAKETADYWAELFHKEQIIGGPVNTLDKTVADPQVQARNMILTLPHFLGGEVKLAGNPAKMAGIEDDKYTAPPVIGQHNDEILKGLLKYSDEKIRKIREEEQKHSEELMPHLQKQTT